MLFYLLPATLVLAITFNALLEDPTTPNSSGDVWTVIVVASIIWPLTLPCILRKRLMSWFSKYGGTSGISFVSD